MKQTLWTGLFLTNGLFEIGNMGSLKSALWTGFQGTVFFFLKLPLWTGLFLRNGFVKQTLWTGLFLMNGLLDIGNMGSLKSALWTGFQGTVFFEIGPLFG